MYYDIDACMPSIETHTHTYMLGAVDLWDINLQNAVTHLIASPVYMKMGDPPSCIPSWGRYDEQKDFGYTMAARIAPNNEESTRVCLVSWVT